MNQGKLYLKMPSPQEANRDIVFMTLPLIVMACYLYGARPAMLCLAAAVTAAVCDYLVAWLRGVQRDRTENSSLPAALVMTLLLPATVPYYVVAAATVLIVLVGKAAFGGVGNYPFNLSALGYCAAAVSWPQHIFRYPAPYTEIGIASTENAVMMDGAFHALRAGGLPNVRMTNLLLGNYAGPMGTTAVLVVIACAMYLWMRREIDLAIPAGFLITCFLFALLLPRVGDAWFTASLYDQVYVRYQSVKYELLTGAMLYAAVFLINDPNTRPRSRRAYFAYGAAIGLATMLFRYFGSYDVGVCFAVLLVNALSGWLDRLLPEKAHRKEAAVDDA